jgi:hypothetical protein
VRAEIIRQRRFVWRATAREGAAGIVLRVLARLNNGKQLELQLLIGKDRAQAHGGLLRLHTPSSPVARGQVATAT